MPTRRGRKRRVTDQQVPVIDLNALTAAAHGRNYASYEGDLFADPNYPIQDFENVYARMRDSKTGIKLLDRSWRFMRFRKCFVGLEAVNWMVNNLHVERKEAVKMGQALIDGGILHHVTNSEPFADHYFFYRFHEDDESSVLNMKRCWDAAIPTRNAVDVSKDLLIQLAFIFEEFRKGILAAKKINNASSPRLQQSTTTLRRTQRHLSNDQSPIVGQTPKVTMTMPRFQNYFFNSAFEILESTSRALLDALPRFFIKSHVNTTPRLERSSESYDESEFPSFDAIDDVDYSAIAESDKFRKFVLAASELQRVQLVALNHHERLAFFVNCYNMLCLHAHVVHGHPTNFIKRRTFFNNLRYRISGLDMSLDDIEHGILRGNKTAPPLFAWLQLRPTNPKCQHMLSTRDGRIHFVISAGTNSDPPIRILDGDNVEEELVNATSEFLDNTVQVDLSAKTVTLPRLMMWYADDFPQPKDNLFKWIAPYLTIENGRRLLALAAHPKVDPRVVYATFEWASAKANFNSSVIRRKRRRLERENSSPYFPLIELDELDRQTRNGTSPYLNGDIIPVPGYPPNGRGVVIPGNTRQRRGQRRAFDALFAPDNETYGDEAQVPIIPTMSVASRNAASSKAEACSEVPRLEETKNEINI